MIRVTRKQAIAAGEKYYFTGEPCKRGHVDPRLVSNNACRSCTRLLAAAWVAKNPEKVKAKERRYRLANQQAVTNKIRERSWKRQGFPAPTRPAPAVCECCLRAHPRTLNLDHCHETGIFRGWLCWDCNSSIGKLGDSVPALENALSYLKRAYA